jgi:hypothetical protein
MQQHLRHRTASGGLVNQWDLDADDKLLCSIQVASGPLVYVVLTVKGVRTRVRERGEYAIRCVSGDGSVWAVEQGVFDADREAPELPPMSLVLTHAPPEVAARLLALAR